MNFSKEPSAIIGTIVAIVTAALALLVAYGFDVSQERQTAILGFVSVIAPLVAAVVIRGNVFAPQSVENSSNQQYRAGLNDATQPDIPAPPATGPVASNTNLGENVRRA
ncbi:MAG: hypothetical protein ACR2OE_15965 [Thermomicrobiales bacterium]